MTVLKLNDADPAHPCIQRLKACAEDGLIHEEVISYGGVDDILVTRVNNPERLYTRAPFVADLCRRRQEQGFSILSDTPYTRQHYWVVTNHACTEYFHKAVPAHRTKIERSGIDIYYPILRHNDTVEKVVVSMPNKSELKPYEVQCDIVRVIHPRCRCRVDRDEVLLSVSCMTSDKEAVLELNPVIDFAHDQWNAHYLRINIPDDEAFQDWTSCSYVLTGAVMDEKFRALRRAVPRVYHPLSDCPGEGDEKCDVELWDNLCMFGRVDRVPEAEAQTAAAEEPISSGCVMS